MAAGTEPAQTLLGLPVDPLRQLEPAQEVGSGVALDLVVYLRITRWGAPRARLRVRR